ncbi:MAG: hypothetical protein ACREXO_03305 [Advenella sp.]
MTRRTMIAPATPVRLDSKSCSHLRMRDLGRAEIAAALLAWKADG